MWVLFVILVIVLLLVFPRRILPIVLGAVLLVGAAGGWHYWQARQLETLERAVSVSVDYAPELCSAAEPLRLTLENQSPATVDRVQWRFSARRAGYRGELTGAWTTVHAIDKPIPPGHLHHGCYPAPQPGEHAVKRQSDRLENLALGIRDKRVTFAE